MADPMAILGGSGGGAAGAAGSIAAATPYGAAANMAAGALKSVMGDDASSSAKGGTATATFGDWIMYGNVGGRSNAAATPAPAASTVPPWVLPAVAALSLGLTLGYMLRKG